MTPSGTPKPTPRATSCELLLAPEDEFEATLEELEHEVELDEEVVVSV
jgi:hypothetical protein